MTSKTRASATRAEVYAVLDGERDYQDDKYPLFEGTSASPEGVLLVVEELVSEARKQWCYA